VKGLAALIRLHTWRLDEKRRELADLQRLEDQFLEDGRRLEAEVVAEQEFAKTSDSGSFSYGGFAVGVIERRKRLEASIAEVRRRIEDKRAEVAEAFQELKRYEITQAERLKRERAEVERRTQASLDEISLIQHQRRSQD
jgi:flagellar protein FliJ